MWCSPELLRKELDDEDRFYGTKEGDVYSFGIIVSELVTVNAPYQQELINLTPSGLCQSLIQFLGSHKVN